MPANKRSRCSCCQNSLALYTPFGNGLVFITIPMRPVSQHRPRAGRNGIMYKDKAQKKNEALFKSLLDDFLLGVPWFKPFTSEQVIHIEMVFVFKTPASKRKSIPTDRVTWYKPRPDVDNLCKFVMDCGNGVLWEDDCQCVSLNASKIYGVKDEIIIKIREVS